MFRHEEALSITMRCCNLVSHQHLVTECIYLQELHAFRAVQLITKPARQNLCRFELQLQGCSN